MDDPTKDLLGSLRASIERLAVAVEEQNDFLRKTLTCPRCGGDGKDYGGRRCVGCAGLGVKPTIHRKEDPPESI